MTDPTAACVFRDCTLTPEPGEDVCDPHLAYLAVRCPQPPSPPDPATATRSMLAALDLIAAVRTSDPQLVGELVANPLAPRLDLTASLATLAASLVSQDIPTLAPFLDEVREACLAELPGPTGGDS